jgi:hypothetical protein
MNVVQKDLLGASTCLLCSEIIQQLTQFTTLDPKELLRFINALYLAFLRILGHEGVLAAAKSSRCHVPPYENSGLIISTAGL